MRLQVVFEKALNGWRSFSDGSFAASALSRSSGEEHLHLQRLLAPERAVVVEGRDALGRRTKSGPPSWSRARRNRGWPTSPPRRSRREADRPPFVPPTGDRPPRRTQAYCRGIPGDTSSARNARRSCPGQPRARIRPAAHMPACRSRWRCRPPRPSSSRDNGDWANIPDDTGRDAGEARADGDAARVPDGDAGRADVGAAQVQDADRGADAGVVPGGGGDAGAA